MKLELSVISTESKVGTVHAPKQYTTGRLSKKMKSQGAFVLTCLFSRNMPELVRTSLWTLLPDSLSATIDFSSLSFAYIPRKSNRINQPKRIPLKTTRSSGDHTHQLDHVVAFRV
jgi:hypothetical protein